VTTHAHQTHAERTPTVLFCRAAVVDGSINEEARTVEFVASTDDLDGHGTIVRQNWDLRRFEPTGVVLYAHDHDDLPIGTAKVRIEGGKLMALVTFSTDELSDKADYVFKNVKAGVIRGISPGFMPHTITFERHDDREVMVLDDNELFELSVTPCPSNANALAQIRSMHAPPAPEPQPTSPPAPAGSAKTETEPSKEEKTMAEPKPAEPTNIITIARALELPAGATEGDAVAAAVRLRQLEVQIQALTGVTSSAEAMGALRAMKEAADKLKSTQEELARVKAERDIQNFEALIAQGQSEAKLTPAEAKFQRDLFEKDSMEGRGEARVAELKGYLAIKSPDIRFAKSVKQPEGNAGAGQPLVWAPVQGREAVAYAKLTYSQRAKLAKENPDLYRLMKDDFEASENAA